MPKSKNGISSGRLYYLEAIWFANILHSVLLYSGITFDKIMNSCLLFPLGSKKITLKSCIISYYTTDHINHGLKKRLFEGSCQTLLTTTKYEKFFP